MMTIEEFKEYARMGNPLNTNEILNLMDRMSNEARKIVETKLPHRTDNKEGYVAHFDAGNRVWLKKR